MGSRPIILVEIGAAPLPDVTPPPRFWSSRLGTPVYNAPATSPPSSVVLTALADGILIVWQPSPNAGARYLVGMASDANGQPGAWEVIADQAGTRFSAAVPTSAPRWYRVQAIAPNGVPSAWTPAQQATAVSVSALAVNLGQVEQTANAVYESITTGTIAQKITGALSSIDDIAWTSIAQSVAQNASNDQARASKAYIKRLDLTKATPEQAYAIAEQLVGAEIGPVSAKVDETSEALVDLSGALSATWSIRTEISDGGNVVIASMAVGVTQAPGQPAQSQVLFYADQFGFLTKANGVVVSPFYVDGVDTYIDNAHIKDGSITNAKIGNVIESDNFDGVVGWQIRKDGSAYFGGDVLFAGDIEAKSITGKFQTRSRLDWSGVLLGRDGGHTDSWSLGAPVKDGQSHEPFIQAELTLINTHTSETCNGYVRLEKQTVAGGSWVVTREQYYSLKSVSTQTYYFQFDDVETAVAVTYRFSVAAGDNNPASFELTGVRAFTQGNR